eukprot:TRINITY_DN2833_c0_g1_i1.p1 TRINITY_DN2833_c0_g1~~TRINITY_DN2833_c0_g1_i1.p1  ORF type:complete len:1467 (-),score=347.38 TRINITY_DN2833_c0_g1_i1:173-4573(-)
MGNIQAKLEKEFENLLCEDVVVRRKAAKKISKHSRNSRLRNAMGEKGGITELVEHAMSSKEDMHVRRHCMRALKNLALNMYFAQEMMHEGLFRVMREVCFEDDVELLRGLADLLRHLAMFCTNRHAFIEDGGIFPLAVLIQYPDVVIQSTAVTVIAFFSMLPEVSQHIRDVIPFIVDMLRAQDGPTMKAALVCVGNISAYEDLWDRFMALDVVNPLFDTYLSSYADLVVIETACLALGNLASWSEDVRLDILRHPGLAALIRGINKRSARAVPMICCNDNHVFLVAHRYGIRTFVFLASLEEEELQEYGFVAVHQLAGIKFRCESCGNDLVDGHKRYHCSICENYDLCESCYLHARKFMDGHETSHTMTVHINSFATDLIHDEYGMNIVIAHFNNGNSRCNLLAANILGCIADSSARNCGVMVEALGWSPLLEKLVMEDFVEKDEFMDRVLFILFKLSEQRSARRTLLDLKTHDRLVKFVTKRSQVGKDIKVNILRNIAGFLANITRSVNEFSEFSLDSCFAELVYSDDLAVQQNMTTVFLNLADSSFPKDHLLYVFHIARADTVSESILEDVSKILLELSKYEDLAREMVGLGVVEVLLRLGNSIGESAGLEMIANLSRCCVSLSKVSSNAESLISNGAIKLLTLCSSWENGLDDVSRSISNLARFASKEGLETLIREGVIDLLSVLMDKRVAKIRSDIAIAVEKLSENVESLDPESTNRLWSIALELVNSKDPSVQTPIIRSLQRFKNIPSGYKSGSTSRVDMEAYSIKCDLDSDIRVITFSAAVRFEELISTVRKAFSIDSGRKLTLSYRDDEGDRVSVQGDNDLEHLFILAAQFSLASPKRMARLYVSLPQTELAPSKTPISARPSPLPDQPPSAGVRKWRLGEFLGRGAYGSVYLGMNSETGELIAVKRVAVSEKDEKSEQLKALEREIGLMKKLQHPNIVRYLGTETRDGFLNIFMEYVPGGSISYLLEKFGGFEESVVRVYLRQILSGLQYLHDHDIVHRDIKGANILVDDKGNIKLADFGASKNLNEILQPNLGLSSICGTPYWMSPEMIRQLGHDKKADIWSVGATAYEMFAGFPPYSDLNASNPIAIMFVIAKSNGPPPMPPKVDLGQDAADFLSQCFRKDPKERPTVEELLAHPFVRMPSIVESEFDDFVEEDFVVPSRAASAPVVEGDVCDIQAHRQYLQNVQSAIRRASMLSLTSSIEKEVSAHNADRRGRKVEKRGTGNLASAIDHGDLVESEGEDDMDLDGDDVMGFDFEGEPVRSIVSDGDAPRVSDERRGSTSTSTRFPSFRRRRGSVSMCTEEDMLDKPEKSDKPESERVSAINLEDTHSATLSPRTSVYENLGISIPLTQEERENPSLVGPIRGERGRSDDAIAAMTGTGSSTSSRRPMTHHFTPFPAAVEPGTYDVLGSRGKEKKKIREIAKKVHKKQRENEAQWELERGRSEIIRLSIDGERPKL